MKLKVETDPHVIKYISCARTAARDVNNFLEHTTPEGEESDEAKKQRIRSSIVSLYATTVPIMKAAAKAAELLFADLQETSDVELDEEDIEDLQHDLHTALHAILNFEIGMSVLAKQEAEIED